MIKKDLDKIAQEEPSEHFLPTSRDIKIDDKIEDARSRADFVEYAKLCLRYDRTPKDRNLFEMGQAELDFMSDKASGPETTPLSETTQGEKPQYFESTTTLEKFIGKVYSHACHSKDHFDVTVRSEELPSGELQKRYNIHYQFLEKETPKKQDYVERTTTGIVIDKDDPDTIEDVMKTNLEDIRTELAKKKVESKVIGSNQLKVYPLKILTL